MLSFALVIYLVENVVNGLLSWNINKILHKYISLDKKLIFL